MVNANNISAAPPAESVEVGSVLTAGEWARLALSKGLIRFAESNLPEFDPGDFLPSAVKVDWENPKASLLNHPGIKKAIRIAASVAAQSQQWELRKHEYLWPENYLAEIHAEMRACTDLRTFNQLEANANAFITVLETCPATIEAFRDYARIHRRNVEYALVSLINFCRRIVGEWLEVIRAESVRELLSEIDRLMSAPLKSQLAYFGLIEFAPQDELPKKTL